MNTGWKNYHSPASVDEALELLGQYDGQARVVAGGTDLLLELQHGGKPPVEALVDVTSIGEMSDIRPLDDDKVVVGGGVSHTQIVENELLVKQATCLVEGCGVIGGPQVRNVGTLGGNVAHALPAGDGTVSLVALDAGVEVVQGGERRRVGVLEMYQGPGQSLLDSTRDMLVSFEFKLSGPGEGTAFKRIMRPQGVALPVLGCAVWVRLGDEGKLIEDLRVCIAPVGPTPTRLRETEERVRGQAVGDDGSLEATLDMGCEAIGKEISPRTSKYRATLEYRLEMAEVLFRRAMSLAIRRAQGGEVIPEGIGLQ